MTHLTSSNIPEPDAYVLAERIAAHLVGPDRWTEKRDPALDSDGERRGYAELRRDADGAEIGVSLGRYPQEGRVSFRAHWPKFADGRPYSPRAHLSITCRATRDPRAIAREVERRLLVDYEPAYRAALEYVRASDAAASEARRAAERIAHSIGAALPREESYRQQRSGGTVEIFGGPSPVRQLRVTPAYSESPTRVSFELQDLDEPTALRVLALLVDADGAAR